MKQRTLLTVSLTLLIAAGFYFAGCVRKRTSAPPAANSAQPSPAVASANIPSPTNAAVKSAGLTNAQQREFDVTVNPYASALREPGKSKRSWDPNFLKSLQNASSGSPIRFELSDGRMASGTVQITQFKDGELTYVSGELSEPEKGTFFFLKPPAGGKAGSAVGIIEFPATSTAYRIEPTGPNGDPELWQRRLDEVKCLTMPRAEASDVDTNRIMEMPPLRPDLDAGDFVPSYNSNVVSLQSYPGSPAVLLLDFFGGYTPTWGGVLYVKPANINNATIKDLWKRVAEDYMPFNINVTTDIKVYQDAPAASRQRVAYTDTPVTAAGVAYVGSWNWGSDTPCWSVYTTGKNGGEVGAHEAGHTLGLSHQGQGDGTTTTNEYYTGQGSGVTGWAPIMGAGYYQPVVTWAKGEYQAANNKEDALHIISSANNNVIYRPDDTGATLASSRYLEIYPDFAAMAEGVIETTGDTDAFQFTTTGGKVSLTAKPVGDWADLALMTTLADSTDTIIASNNPQATLYATITTNLPAGTYTFRVTGTGRNNPLTTGFSSYASLGYYSIFGSVAGGRLSTRLSVMEHSTNGTVVGTIPAGSPGDSLTYTILSGNTNGTFAVDANGLVSVATNTLLDYKQLGSNSTTTAVQFEMMVDITDDTNPGLSESSRRVVISVLDSTANYPIAVTGFNAGIIVPYNATLAAPKATGFDIPNNYSFYQAGLNGNAQVSSGGGMQGLPGNGTIFSQTDNSTFQLGPYGSNNALIMGNTYPASGTLTLATPCAYNSISVLASSANGGGVGTFVLNFTNGTKSQVFSFNAQDWFNVVTNVAITGLGRLKLGQGNFLTEDNGSSNPNLYATTINLAALGLNQAIASITFTNPLVSGSRDTAVFALSGNAMASAPTIGRQPSSLTNSDPNSAAIFSVAAMGAPTLGYQWFTGTPGNSSPIAGQTFSTLTLFPVQLSNATNYFVVVTNSTGSVTSSVVALTVFRAPQITQQPGPTNLVLFTGQTLSLSVAANAAVPTKYYWNTNGTFIPNKTNAVLTLSNLQLSNSGIYSVVVSNAFGSVTSGIVSLTVVSQSYPFAQMVLGDHPLGYWRLDELSGTLAHDYAGTNNGTYLNVQLGQTGNKLIDTHKVARFGILSSVNSYVGSIPIDFTSTTNRTFSVEAWVNGGTQSTDAGIVSKGTGGGGEQFNLDCGGANHAFRFFIRDMSGSAAHIASGSVVPNGQWHHLVGVCDQIGGTITLYVDGVSNASATATGGSGIKASTNAVAIGSRQSGTTTYNNQFVGSIEEVALYNYALTPAQVQAHYIAVSNRAPVFVTNPFSTANANAGIVYAAGISTNATDPNGDTVSFSKLSGPSWLTVSSSGTLSGTPLSADVGTNSFVIRAMDTGSLSSTATLNITVIPPAPIVAGVTFDGTNVVLNWSGGIAPYQVLMNTNMADTNWDVISGMINSNTLFVAPSNPAAFFRIQGQ